MPQTAWLSTLYQQYRRELFLAAWTVLRQVDLSEDAVHTAFAKLVKLSSKPSDPKLFVFRCVRNAALDLARTRTRRREEPMPADWDAPGAEPELPDSEVMRAVGALLERLDAASREVIELHLHASLKFEEIARLLEEPLPTIASRYRRALDKLRQQIKVPHE
jgi:RNA polymerase sigma-70 factor (ECF subfamily)